MSLKIVRNDITKMNTDAIVNTASETTEVGDGCDVAIYMAAGYDELHKVRLEIGEVAPGEVFITPGYNLPAKFIIHAVSPVYIDGKSGEEKLLRACYRRSLKLARKNGLKSISFPLISTGSFGYPKEEGIRIAVDEINAFLIEHNMDVYLVVFDYKSTRLGFNIYPDLESFIDHKYVEEKREEEYGDRYFGSVRRSAPGYKAYSEDRDSFERELAIRHARRAVLPNASLLQVHEEERCRENVTTLAERMRHAVDPFGKYLLYIIDEKGMTNAEVYKRGLISKQSFGKLKKDPSGYHPDKITALQYCVGAKLNIDETKDMLARAGYALSPADKRDIIFEYFITNEVYDMIDIDIALEEHDIPCVIK